MRTARSFASAFAMMLTLDGASAAAAEPAAQGAPAASAEPAAQGAPAVLPPDPYTWLEDVEGERALAWVAEQNARSLAVLEARPEFRPTFDRVLEILDSKEKIPVPTLFGTTVYNFWKDDRHERGIWRRTTLESYRTEQPAWETVLDVDELARRDGTPWVFDFADCLPPEHRRCLIALSRGGADAQVVREFDTRSKSFVEGGFTLPEAKSWVGWRDADSIWVGTDFGEGSLTASGYSRIAKLWRRGTSLTEATTFFEGKATDVGAGGYSIHTPERRYDVIHRTPAYFQAERFLVLGDRLVRLELPTDAVLQTFFDDQMVVSLRTPWETGGVTHVAGSLIAIDLDDFLRGERGFEVLFTPTDRVSLSGVSTTRGRLLVETLDNIRSKLAAFTHGPEGWKRSEVELPGVGTAGVVAASDWADVYFASYTDFLTPATLWLGEGDAALVKTKSNPAFFDPTGMAVAQHEAVSEDGTRIPYFLVTPRGFVADGTAPTLLYGYGGFEVAEVPAYSGAKGEAWFGRGGVYVLANIRGGGEFGPRWHEAALRENRIKSFEDFIAVAEDLVARKVTSPRHLGIMGGSQGGLLVGGAMTMRPDLFGAVVAQIPLADMRRYSQLLAGASWMAEYGDPDVPEDWAFIQTWSPYHLLRQDAKYPTPFFWTNTRDDRVHPAHARKMVARMLELGHPVYYFENTEGGHGSGAVNEQTARVTALEYAYLWMMLR
jgi:prolyl oligopeptidase